MGYRVIKTTVSNMCQAEKISLFLYFKLIFITIIAIVFKLNNPLQLINSKLDKFDDFKNL